MELDINLNEFINMLYSTTAMPPFSYFLSDANDAVLGEILVRGANALYNTSLCKLSAAQIEKLREYLLSIGWDADYNLVVTTKEVLAYHESGDPYVKILKINNWQITFKPAPR